MFSFLISMGLFIWNEKNKTFGKKLFYSEGFRKNYHTWTLGYNELITFVKLSQQSKLQTAWESDSWQLNKIARMPMSLFESWFLRTTDLSEEVSVFLHRDYVTFLSVFLLFVGTTEDERALHLMRCWVREIPHKDLLWSLYLVGVFSDLLRNTPSKVQCLIVIFYAQRLPLCHEAKVSIQPSVSMLNNINKNFTRE